MGPGIVRKFVAELLGTFFLVFIAVGVATLSFGFGFAGHSVAAGVIATALAFGLVLLILCYAIGPITGCHVNPAVTLGAVLARRITPVEAVVYWVAQFAGGILGALVLWAIFKASPAYSTSTTGLGADGYGKASMIHIGMGGAFAIEAVLTALFVLVVLCVTNKVANAVTAGIAIGLALTTVHLIGVPVTGTSVNPARALGPAVMVGGLALSQVWLFIVAPFVGGIVAAMIHWVLYSPRALEQTALGQGLDPEPEPRSA